MVQLVFSVVLGWMAFYWLPTIPALVAFAILVFFLTGRLGKALKRGRRILAERRKEQEEEGDKPEKSPRPRGKHDGFLAMFYWRESMVHAMLLGVMAGGAFGSEGGGFGMGGGMAGGDAGGDYGGGFGDMGGGDMGGGGGGGF